MLKIGLIGLLLFVKMQLLLRLQMTKLKSMSQVRPNRCMGWLCMARRNKGDNLLRRPVWNDPGNISKNSLPKNRTLSSWSKRTDSPPRRGGRADMKPRPKHQGQRTKEKSSADKSGFPPPYNKHLFRTRLHVALKKNHAYNRTIIIGDVHGCYREFLSLLKKINYNAQNDRLILTGDLVGKGPHSKQVVEFVRKVGGYAVRGNHDHRVVKASLGLIRTVKKDVQALVDDLGKENLQWLATLPLSLYLEEYKTYIVHAGALPNSKIEHNSPELLMNLRGLYGKKPTMKHGEGSPWAEKWEGPELIIFGHDATRSYQQYEYAVGIDTGCVHGGRLTSLVLPECKLYNVQARKTYKKPKVPLVNSTNVRPAASNRESSERPK
mmetsp:Transcript_4403/g.6593  ORF Transcript_4403/g.6593 Transcript_4403/m.6593 type:complete len:379 (-) Transcript_4403:12-1148(-)